MSDRPTDFLTLLEALTSAYTAVITGLEDIPDLQERFDHATVTADLVRGLSDDAYLKRARAAGLLAERDRLSLGKLAKRIGVSKAQANRMVTNYKQQEEGRGT